MAKKKQEPTNIIEGDFSIKLNFKGELTLDVIQDALRGAQILVERSQIILNKVFQERVDLGKITVQRIEAGSFASDLKTAAKLAGHAIKLLTGQEVSLGKTITICTTALLLAGAGMYTFREITGLSTGAIDVGDQNQGIVGSGNTNNTINNITGNTIHLHTSQEAMATALKERFPADPEICDAIATSIITNGSEKTLQELQKSAVLLKYPGGNEVDSIELGERGGTDDIPVQAVIEESVLKDIPSKYEEPEKPEEKRLIQDVSIEIMRMNLDTAPEGKWGAIVEDIETGLPDKTLVLIVDKESDVQKIRDKMSTAFRVDMWAVYKRDAKGNPNYIRYILKDVK